MEALGQAKTLLCIHTSVCPKAQWEIHRMRVRARQRKWKTSSGGRGGELGLGSPGTVPSTPLLCVGSSPHYSWLGPPFPPVSLTTQSMVSSSHSSGFAQPGPGFSLSGQSSLEEAAASFCPGEWRWEGGHPCSSLKRPSPAPGGLLGQPSLGVLPGPSLVPLSSCGSENPRAQIPCCNCRWP